MKTQTLLLVTMVIVVGCSTSKTVTTHAINGKEVSGFGEGMVVYENQVLAPELDKVSLSEIKANGRALLIIPSRETISANTIVKQEGKPDDALIHEMLKVAEDISILFYKYIHKAVFKAQIFTGVDMHLSDDPGVPSLELYDYIFSIEFKSSDQVLKLKTKLSPESFSVAYVTKDLSGICESITNTIKRLGINDDSQPSVSVSQSPTEKSHDVTILDEFMVQRRAKTDSKYAVAVIFGSQQYKGDVPMVSVALRDAYTMKKFLIETMGYRPENVIYIENPTLSDFNSVFGTDRSYKGRLFNYVKPNGNSDVFVYYSGHGAPDPENQSAFFVPIDCDPATVVMGGYSMETFYKNLSEIPARNITVVIDACFSGGSHNGNLLKNMSPIFINTQKTEINKENTSVFNSATANQVSTWYEEKGHSLLTYYYLLGMRGEADANKDSKITVGEMQSWIDDNVPYMARRLNNREQTPTIQGNPDKILIEY